MALSNNVIGAINFVAMLLSIPIIGAGIWLATEPDNSCVKILQWPVIILGILIFLVALAGFVGGFWRIPWLLIFYLVAMLVVIILLASLVVFIYMVTIRGQGHVAPSRAYLEYHLDDFSGWLRRRVRSSFKWDRIRTCLSSTTMCAELNQTYRMALDFFDAHITPLQVYILIYILSFFIFCFIQLKLTHETRNFDMFIIIIIIINLINIFL